MKLLKFFRVAFIISGMMLFYECTTEQPEAVKKSGNIEVSRSTFSLYLDNLTPFGVEINISGVTEENEVILTNTINNSIDFYSLDDGKLTRRMNIPREGKGKVDFVAGSMEIGVDSLLIFNKFVLNGAKLYDLEEDRLINDRFFGPWDVYQQTPVNVVCSSSTPPVAIDQKVYFLTWPLGEININENTTIYSEFEYDRLNQTLTHLPVTYPELYKKGKYPAYFVLPMRCFVPGETKLVYSWPLSNELGVFDIKTNELQWVSVENATTNVRFVAHTQDDGWRNILRNNHYNGILYDEQKKLYYRFFFKAIENSSYEKDFESDPYPIYRMPFYIQVIDQNFIEVGKIKMAGGKYDVFRAFVHNGKLFMSKNNLYNEKLDENILAYEVLEVTHVAY
jgi:hypothetical protein